MSGYRGRHWPKEEQNANAPEGFAGLLGDDAKAALVKTRWAAVFPPFDVGSDYISPTELPEGRYRHGC